MTIVINHLQYSTYTSKIQGLDNIFGGSNMIIKIDDIHELRVSENLDGSCVVDFFENGKRLGSECWATTKDVIAEYC